MEQPVRAQRRRTAVRCPRAGCDGRRLAGQRLEQHLQLDGVLTGLAADTRPDGTVELVAVRADGWIYHRYGNGAGTFIEPTWSSWSYVDGLLDSVAVARNTSGALDVFGTNWLGMAFT